MVNIDFHEQAAQKNSSENEGLFSLLGGWQIALLLLMLTFTVYGVSYYYKKIIETRVAETENQIKQERSDINREYIKKVISLAQRKNIIAQINKEKFSSIQKKLFLIEDNLNQGVYLTEFNFQQKDSSITLSAVAANYHAIAQQIYDFKNNDNIVSIQMKKASRNKNGGVGFDLNLKVK